MNDILKKNNINPIGYENKGNITIVETKEGKYIYKKEKIDEKIINYLKTRSFDYIPLYLEKEGLLYKYIDEVDIPREKKIILLTKLVALLHSKTTFYKEKSKDDIERICDDLEGNLSFLYNYYTDLITKIESKVYPSPSQQVLAHNISKIYDSISVNKKRLDKYYSIVKDKTKQRNVVIHGNLNLSHFISNKKSYLISWEKSRIDIPIFDLYKLYLNHYREFDFRQIIKTYEKIYPLKKEEKIILIILMSMPDVIDLKGSEYEKCLTIKNMMDRLERVKTITKDI